MERKKQEPLLFSLHSPKTIDQRKGVKNELGRKKKE
jgi:hypothetical protein